MKTRDPTRTLLRQLKRRTATKLTTTEQRTAAFILDRAGLAKFYTTTNQRVMATSTRLGAAVNRGAAAMPNTDAS